MWLLCRCQRWFDPSTSPTPLPPRLNQRLRTVQFFKSTLKHKRRKTLSYSIPCAKLPHPNAPESLIESTAGWVLRLVSILLISSTDFRDFPRFSNYLTLWGMLKCCYTFDAYYKYLFFFVDTSHFFLKLSRGRGRVCVYVPRRT